MPVLTPAGIFDPSIFDLIIFDVANAGTDDALHLANESNLQPQATAETNKT